MGYKLSKIYVGSQKVRPPLKTYTPTANTVVYLPMRANTTTTDYGTGGWTWTTHGSGTFVDNYWSNGSDGYIDTGYRSSYTSYSSYTIIIRMKVASGSWYMFEGDNRNSGDSGNITIECNASNSKFRRYNGSSSKDISITPTYSDGQWHMFAGVGSSGVYYVDGVQKGTNTSSVTFRPAQVCVGAWRGSTYGAGDYSDLIIEDRVWSAAEILNHYNTYKENYGL